MTDPHLQREFDLTDRCYFRTSDGFQCVLASPHLTIHEFADGSYDAYIGPPLRAEWNAGETRMPTDPQDRKDTPIFSGVLSYFPDALAEIARVSLAGNRQHNGNDAPLHWAREKSTDEADALVRHLLERGKRDTDGMRHSAKVAWRALAMLQRELDAER